MDEFSVTPVNIALNGAVVAVSDRSPRILCVPVNRASGSADSLPHGAFDPTRHRTFETGLRQSVESRAALKLGYVEQLYTFGDRGRHRVDGGERVYPVSVGYLALARIDPDSAGPLQKTGARWRDWYELFPWEDWRNGRPALLNEAILPRLRVWSNDTDNSDLAMHRQSRLRLAFGIDDFPWDEERVLDRYELLYEAGMVEESVADGRYPTTGFAPPLGFPMLFDHRRIAATAIQRLRAKIKYRPVIFELMPPEFTLTELQTTVEAISGRHLHKQNFRRLVEGAALVEATGHTSAITGGRPAALYRFRSRILEERPAPGLRFSGRG